MDNQEISLLQKNLRRTQMALFMLFLLFVAAGIFFFLQMQNSDGGIIRARGIVIEDSYGKARVVLGAPTPDIPGRTRTEAVNGILLLGPNGADRMVISYPGIEPQVMGNVGKRSIAVPSAGLMINDEHGNERAGFGVSDDGNRISLGLDYSDRDAMGLIVSPNFSGLAAFSRTGERNDQITLGVMKNGTAQLKLADSNGDEHFILEAQKDSAPKFQLLNSSKHKLENVAAKLVH